MKNKKYIIKKDILEKFLRKNLGISNLNEFLDSEDWPVPKGDSHPAVVNEPPMEKDTVSISPAAQTQVTDPDLPIDDPDWFPGSKTEMIKATSQLVEDVPDNNLHWFWGRLKGLVEKSNSDGGEAGTGDMDYEETEAEILPQDKQRQRTNLRGSSGE